MTIQKNIDALAYPPTHNYDYETMTPQGSLAERWQLLNKIAPSFWNEPGHSFLDISCNKGFFTKHMSTKCGTVCALDIDKSYTDLVASFGIKNIDVVNASFRDYIPKQQYSRIYIGNVHHYLYKDSGWEWVDKLAAISGGEVIIEGPCGMPCKDMDYTFQDSSQEVKDAFNENMFLSKMSEFFTLNSKNPTTSYTPDRYIYVFTRKLSYGETTTFLSEVKNKKSILRVNEHGEDKEVFTTDWQGKEVIAKVHYKPTHPDLFPMNIHMAVMSPYGNGNIGFICDDKDGSLIGWLEEKSNSPIYQYKQNEVEILKQVCRHNIYLSKLGYFDLDCATINFFKEPLKTFDKDLVYPVKFMQAIHAEQYLYRMSCSYGTISQEIKDIIESAILSRDCKVIEDSFKKILEMLEK